MRRTWPRKLATITGVFATAAAFAATPAEAATVKLLHLTWHHQSHSYNCGPTATQIAISAHLPAASIPSQDTIGAYEGTSAQDGTNRQQVRGGLAHYDTRVPWTVVSNQSQGGYFSAAEAQAFHAHIRSDIDAGKPLVVNIVVYPGGARPPGWGNPSGTIDHWVVVSGYDSVGNAMLTDPASTGPGFNKLSSYWISLGTLDHLVRKTYIW